MESNEVNDENEDGALRRRGSLSVKDAGVILTMSTLVSMSLVAGTLGFSGISERFSQKSIVEVLMTLSLFIGLFTFISYLLVKMAAHYLVYLAIRLCCALIFPVSQRRQNRAMQEIYGKAEKRS